MVIHSCLSEVSWNTEENNVKVGAELAVHPVVDDWINTGIGHGQPVEAKINVVNVGHLGDGGCLVAQEYTRVGHR